MKITTTLTLNRSEIKAIEDLGFCFNDFIKETMNESVDGFKGFLNNITVDSTVRSKANYLAYRLHFVNTLEMTLTFESQQVEDVCELGVELLYMVTPAIKAYNKLIADISKADDSKLKTIAKRLASGNRITNRKLDKSFTERK